MKPKIRFVGGMWECRNVSNFTLGFGNTPEEAYRDYLEWQTIDAAIFPKPVDPRNSLLKLAYEPNWLDKFIRWLYQI